MVDAVGVENISAFASRRPPRKRHQGVPVYDLLGGWAGRVSTGLFRRAGMKASADQCANFWMNRVIRTAIHQTQPDTVFVQFANLALLLAPTLRDFSGAVFVHCHGVDMTWDKFEPRPPAPTEKRWLDYRQRVVEMSRFARFIANSKWTAQHLMAAGMPPDRIDLKYLGVPVPPTCRRGVRESLTVLYVGRLIDFKGPELTIQAFEKLANKMPDVELKLVGDGNLMAECHQLKENSRHRERIHLLGALQFEQVQQLMNEADIFTAHSCQGAQSHQFEAFGVAFVEAMASGLPVVTGAAGGPCETVVDGETGFLFPPGDIDAHAAALLTLAQDPTLRSRMGDAGRQRAIELFSTQVERGATAAQAVGHSGRSTLMVHRASDDL